MKYDVCERQRDRRMECIKRNWSKNEVCLWKISKNVTRFRDAYTTETFPG